MNCASPPEARVTWRQIDDVGTRVRNEKYPANDILWFPRCKLTNNLWLHRLRAAFYHWLPALIIDMLVSCFGYKPLYVLNLCKHVPENMLLRSIFIQLVENSRQNCQRSECIGIFLNASVEFRRHSNQNNSQKVEQPGNEEIQNRRGRNRRR